MPSYNIKYTALALLAGLAVANGQTTIKRSSASCKVKSISKTSKVEQDGYANAWLDIGNYVCGNQADEPVIVNIDKQVEDVAIAIAEAFAEVSINCKAQGNANVRAQGYAFAEERAVALGEAIAEIFASSETCGQCTATISALSKTSKELVSVAVAEAWAELYLLSDNAGKVEGDTTVTSHVITETIETVLASITGTIRAAANDGCDIEAINKAQVGDHVAMCELAVSGGIRQISVDAMAEAGAEAAAYACEGDTATANVDVIARATAQALAEAVAQADVYCETRGGVDTIACGLAEVDVRAVANAQAEAFAKAMATAETCGCDVSAHAEIRVWDEIWVEAVTNAYAETCVGGNGEDFVTDFGFAVEERMLTATARAIASAVAEAGKEDGNTCQVSLDVCANTSEQCVGNHRQCGGGSFEYVLPCCNEAYRCIVMNDSRYLCRHRSARVPSFWDGRIAECNLPEE